MESKEKAKELIDKIYAITPVRKTKYLISQDKRIAIMAASILVDEILSQYNTGKFDYKMLDEEESDYWQQVKQCIEEYGK